MTGTPGTLPTTLPELDDGSLPFWAALGRGRIRLPRCSVDSELIWIPRPFCPRHPLAEVSWDEVRPTGTVYSYTVVYRGEGLFAGAEPFVLAYVDLDDGPRVLSNVLVPEGASVAVGDRVEACFPTSTEDRGLLRFVATSRRP